MAAPTRRGRETYGPVRRDLAELIVQLGLKNITIIGHSMARAEVAHISVVMDEPGREVVLVGAVPPLMLKTQANPKAAARSVRRIRKGTAGDRSSTTRT